MEEIAYHRSCPFCGGNVDANCAAPDTPPWRCAACLWSFWVAQMTPEARCSVRPSRLDWGEGHHEATKKIHADVEAERLAAHVRGVSVRREQLGLVNKDDLALLLKRHHLSPHFAELFEGAR